MKRESFEQQLEQSMQQIFVPESLRRKTLDALKEQEEKPMKKKLALALVLILIAMGAAALAAANHAGIVDFITRFADTYIPADASSHMKTDVAAFENDLLSVHLRETYYDGRALRMTVDITPKNPGMLLIGMDSSTQDSWQDLIHLRLADADQQDKRTILAASKELHYEQIWQTSVFVRESGDNSAWGDYVLDPSSGTMTYCLNEEWLQNLPQRSLTLYVQAIPASDAAKDQFDRSSRILLEYPLSVDAASSSKRYESTSPVLYESIGVRIDKLALEVLPLDIYAVIDYTVIDEEAFAKTNDGLWFEFIDPESEETQFWNQRLTSGFSATASVTEVSAGRYRQTESLGCRELYESYTLRAYECWEKQRFDTHTIPVFPVK